MQKNKIMYGLKNVHYASVTETVNDGVITSTYGTPKPWSGSVSLSLNPTGGSNPFYADDTTYAVLDSNTGYEGDFEVAMVPDDVEINVFGNEQTEDGIVYEASENKTKYIALLFEIDGDVKARRYVLYRNKLTRAAVGSQTKTDSTEPTTKTLTITATPRPDTNIIGGKERHLIKANTSDETTNTVYNNWFNTVWVPTDDSVG